MRQYDTEDTPGNNECRGCFELGSACGDCSRCTREMRQMLIAAVIANGYGQTVISPEVWEQAKDMRLGYCAWGGGNIALTVESKNAWDGLQE